jgi:HSP20 family molecular chaperone IbpA
VPTSGAAVELTDLPDKVDGTLSDGVLTVRLGKASKSQPRRIEIKSS